LPDHLDLIVAQPTLVIEVAVPVLGQPRRHRPAGHRLNDLASAAANRVVLEDAERRAGEADRIGRPRGLIDRTMTCGAVLIENWRHVAIERRGRAPLTSNENHRGHANPQAPTPNLQPQTSNL
jgi:hypothetical protein